MKSQYNWPLLKTEYLAGDIQDAREFLRQRLGISEKKLLSTAITRMTKGWAKDWKENQTQIAKAALERSNKSREKRLAEGLDSMRDFFERVAEFLTNTKGFHMMMRVDAAEKVWKILRVENGLPATISKNVITPPIDPEDALNKLQYDANAKNKDSTKIQNNKQRGRRKVVSKH